jgi:hypothetical protein
MVNNRSRLPETRQTTSDIASPSGSGAGLSVDDPVDRDSEHPPPLPTFTQMEVSGHGNMYTNYSHWSSLLNGIFEHRQQTGSDDQTPEPSASTEVLKRHNPGPMLLYGCITALCKEELQAGLPPRSTADRLLSRYFRALDLSSSE